MSFSIVSEDRKMNLRYAHTQIGYLIITAGLFFAAYFSWINQKEEIQIYVMVIMAFVLFLLGSFSTLRVTIDDDYLMIKFGYGIYKNRLRLNQIVDSEIVKNRWYYGWGIRYNFYQKFTIYNVSGFGAVEIVLKDGNKYRIGTDEPEKLKNALKKAISNSK